MEYDLIVIGGGTAGCACAYTAGILGLKTLLIEKNSFLGGTMTSALVTPAMSTKTDSRINTDFYSELMARLNKIGGQITYSDGNIGWFNPELMKLVLDDMMEEANVTVLLDTEVNEIIRNKDRILGITLEDKVNKNFICSDTIYTNNTNTKDEMLLEYIEAKYFVDGTADGKIFEKINLKFLNNFEKNLEKKYQPANLRFIMSGVNIKEFSEWILKIDNDRNVTTSCNIDGQVHLSTAYTTDNDKWALTSVFRTGIDEGLIAKEDCNYFQLFTIPKMPESIAFNCPRSMEELDIYDKTKVSSILKKGRRSIYRLAEFMKKKFKGFEKSYISSIANTLGVRVSNRIRGKYVYTIDDLKTGKIFKNPVLISKYPIDVHSSRAGESVLEKTEVEYMLPIEALMSYDYDNLFAIGRCISADFMSQAALRIIPSCFSMGEGLAKYLAKSK